MNYMISFLKGGWLCAVLVLALTACGGSDDTVADKGGDTKESATTVTPADGNDLYGVITDDAGTGVAGVTVSDGYSCVQTDARGFYQMRRNADAHFVNYSIPSGYKAQSNRFYKRLTSEKRYDFTLQRLAADEDHFLLLAIGDPQVTNNSQISRFTGETLPDIRQTLASTELPAYGICLGDIVNDRQEHLSAMQGLLNSTSMPVFATPGNHDKARLADTSKPRGNDDFEREFGPRNYSFNRGRVHIVCLDDVMFTNSEDYTAGFTDEQVEWLREDLSFVPKNRLVILFYHIPLRDADYKNRRAVLALLDGFAASKLMSGHTHYQQSYAITSPISIEERVTATACGAWWHSTVNTDGTPNGYAVYEINGTSIVDNYYKSTNYPRSYQIRLLHGDAEFGGDYDSFGYGLGSGWIVANVWNYDPTWRVSVYEDGAYSGDMASAWQYFHTDAWAVGYHVGVENRAKDSFAKSCFHDFVYKLKNPEAKVEVVATDGFGNEYRQSEFTTDLTSAESYISK